MTERVTARMKIEALIAGSQDKVFLTREFAGLGSKDQVTRAVRALVRDHQLVRMGHGVYARAFTSRLSGDPVLYNEGGFIGAARQALDKLGVLWKYTDAQLAYREGRSNQIPVNPVVRIKGRFRWKLRVGKTELRIER